MRSTRRARLRRNGAASSGAPRDRAPEPPPAPQPQEAAPQADAPAADSLFFSIEEINAWVEGDKEERAELDPEDDALLLRAWQLRMGSLPDRSGRPLRYRHVAVDAVQDFSPLEVQVLMDCLDEHRSLTLAGDTQQHVMQEAGFTSWTEFFRHLGLEGTEVDTLQVSYRSSEEIARFAVELLGDLREDDFPLLTTIASNFEFIDSIQRENGVTILWRLRSTRYAGEFLGLLTLQAGEAGMEITAVSVN